MKQGYLVQAEEYFEGERKWWWNFIWDSNAPNKVKILLWMVLKNNDLDLG
jgi:hypothetical protein